MSFGPFEPNVIYLQYPTIQCCICGQCDVSRWGIPVDSNDGMIVANDFEGEWGGKPACRECWAKHEAGEFVGTYPRF